MQTPKLILTIGPSSSGKSTWTEEFVLDRLAKEEEEWVNLNRDDYRFALFTNGERDWTKYKFNKTNEERVSQIQEEKAKWARFNGSNIIISDTNLNPEVRVKWKNWAKESGYEYEEKLFPCDWKELVKRNAQRQGGLSEALLWDQYKRYMQQFGYYGEHKVEMYKETFSRMDTVWVDIDGTIARMKDRKPFEWDKVGSDEPRREIIAMVESLGHKAHHVTFMSGREDCCYEQTKKWLEDNVDDSYFTWDLYMRKSGDTRRDDIVKYEMYLNHIKDKYNVLAVFDDRPQVIRMQTVVGFPNIIQVGEYNKEF